ncbi:hypothetical protein [Methylocystis rosea]|uniref:Uncharacterized protein n=1 Tax=Methylocystis rosea TaxID=173366 RepID=A0A3G8M4W5_9HYPH|nr:hypothetical protein [Methylocystis rosea]AZG75988.1 hypothetical protein EHO51_04150 [Methylocystis rosea]
MAIFDFLKPKTGDVASLETQLQRLLAEKAQVTAEVEAYGSRRADLLLSDSDDDAIVRFDTEHAKACVRLERLEVGEIALLERIAVAKDATFRAAEALRREKSAEDLTQRAVVIDRTFGTLCAQLEEFIAATPPDCIDIKGYREFYGIGSALTPTQVASALLTEALYQRMPDLFEQEGRDIVGNFWSCKLPLRYRKKGSGVSAELPKGNVEIRFLPFSGAADETLIAPMRDKALSLRASEEMREAAE